MIVDEEQRFGVRHKEQLKKLKKEVDVLTMSATPIPRTLHMSLGGLRDISVIETPPNDRLAIQTVVAPFNEELIKSAIMQEMERAGRSSSSTTAWNRSTRWPPWCSAWCRAARIGVAHGQMGGEGAGAGDAEVHPA